IFNFVRRLNEFAEQSPCARLIESRCRHHYNPVCSDALRRSLLDVRGIVFRFVNQLRDLLRSLRATLARGYDSRLSHSPSFGKWRHVRVAHKLYYALEIVLFLVRIIHRDGLDLVDLYERESSAASFSVFDLCCCAARAIPE